MALEVVRATLLAKLATTEETPFGPETWVYKVKGKMFALLAWSETPLRVTLKCQPSHALALRTLYPAVTPGYYMNKAHWNTVLLDGSIPIVEIEDMMEASYQLVVAGLPKTERLALAAEAVRGDGTQTVK